MHVATTGTYVKVSADGQQLFPQQCTKAMLWEDVHHEWNLRGAYDAELKIDGAPFQECLGRVSVQSQRICMDVPRRQQLSEQISAVADVLQHSLSRDREASASRVADALYEEPVVIDCGAAVLRHFLSGEVHLVGSGSSRLSKWWTLQAGPFAEHKLELTKPRFSSILTLKVDGSVLAECTGKDLGSANGEWRCKFRLLGERCIDFNVHPETKDGVQMDSKQVVTKSFPFEHVLEVVYKHRKIDQLSDAELLVDGVPFGSLPIQACAHNEPHLQISKQVLALSYGLEIPRKVLPQDTRGTARKVAQRVWSEWKDPLNQVVAQKAADASTWMSKISSGASEFISLQRAAWSADMSSPAEEGMAKSVPPTARSRIIARNSLSI